MPLSLKNPEADRLARELARRQGRSITDAVIGALEAELERVRRRLRPTPIAERLLEIGARYQQLPTLDQRTEEEILGYDDAGAPR
jgi:antitoxin VapB